MSDLDLLSRPYAATYVSNASALCSVLLLSFCQLTPLFARREVCRMTWSEHSHATGQNTLRNHEVSSWKHCTRAFPLSG